MKKGTIIAAVILVALVAVYFATHQEPQTTLEAPYEISKVENLSRIEIERPKGENKLVVLEKSGESWSLTKPVEAPLDPKVAEKVDEVFTDRILTDDIKIPNDKAALYDLGDEAVDVALFADGASEPAAKFKIGKEVTVEGTGAKRSFMMTSDGEIYRLRASLEVLRKPVSDLRSKKILEADRNAIETVRIKRDGTETLVSKEGEDQKWMIKEPELVETEPSAINGLVGALSRLNASGFADDEKPADVGLDNPIELVTHAGDQKIVLHVSQHEGKFYVKKPDGKFIYEVDANTGKRLDVTVNSLRNRMPKKLTPDAINTVQFAGPGVTIKKPAGPDAKWQMNGKDLGAKVNSYVGALAKLRVARYVDVSLEEAGLTNPDDRVVIQHVDGRETLLIGNQVDDGGDRYAKWQDLDLVFVLSKGAVDRLMPKASDLEG